MKDEGYHKQLRENVINFIASVDPNIKLITSHTSDKDIELFCYDSNHKIISISQPDILCLKGDKVNLIVEIERCSTPKHLLGVFLANMMSKGGRFKNLQFMVNQPPIMIIVPYEDMEKDGSIKSAQVETIVRECYQILRTENVPKLWIKKDNEYEIELKSELNKMYQNGSVL